jgi:hypothetical protein
VVSAALERATAAFPFVAIDSIHCIIDENFFISGNIPLR